MDDAKRWTVALTSTSSRLPAREIETAMQQLSGADTGFLTMETPTVFGHIAILCIYKQPSPNFVPIEAVYERYSALVSQIEPLHRRLVEVPFELDLPYWVV